MQRRFLRKRGTAERISLRTLPKSAGNISLSLREWGLFCIESRLQGADGVCYTYGMEESNTTLQQRMEADPMKKLARLTALLLTCALLLVLTACGAVVEPETEQQAKQRLLKEINSYRASIHLDPLEEVKQLSDAEQVWAEQFRAAGKTALPKSETDEVFDRWVSMTEDWIGYDDFGWGWDPDEKINFLSAKVPANTPEGKAELLKELRDSGTFDDDGCKHIGIAVVTIKGQMYWTCDVFYN